jgi:hypothetical protein
VLDLIVAARFLFDLYSDAQPGGPAQRISFVTGFADLPQRTRVCASVRCHAAEELGCSSKRVGKLNRVWRMINLYRRYSGFIAHAAKFSGATLDRKPANNFAAMWRSSIIHTAHWKLGLQCSRESVGVTWLLPCFHEAAAFYGMMCGIIQARVIVISLHVCEGRHIRAGKAVVVILELPKSASFNALPSRLKHGAFVSLEFTSLKNKPVNVLEVVSLVPAARLLNPDLEAPRVYWARCSIWEDATILDVPDSHHRLLIATLCRSSDEHHRL